MKPLEDKNGHLIKKVGKGYELVYDERCEVCKKNHKEKMIPTQIIDVAVRDICQVAVTAAPKSEVREIVVKAIKEMLEEVVNELNPNSEEKITACNEYSDELQVSITFDDGWMQGFEQAEAQIHSRIAQIIK